MGQTKIDTNAVGEVTKISTRSESEVTSIGVKNQIRHDTLTGRNTADQHSIESITGLSEALIELHHDTFIYEQGETSDTWRINHNLGKYPSVTLVDSANTQFVAQVEYIDENNCVVYMNGATKGKAYLN